MSKTRLDNIPVGRFAKLWDDTIIRVEHISPGSVRILHVESRKVEHIARAALVTPVDPPVSEPGTTTTKARLCRTCGETGHNSRTCKKGEV